MEIERKWLIKAENIPFDLNGLQKLEIEQFYIISNPTIRARKINDEQFILTIKSKYECPDTNLERNETECRITEEEYSNLKKLRTGKTVKKTRYIKNIENNLKMEIDIFKDHLEGLAYLEIEFENVDEAKEYAEPGWIEKEVTEDKNYSNYALSQIKG